MTLFVIAKTIAYSLRDRPSEPHFRFISGLDEWIPIITFNWDVLIESAVLRRERRVSYAIPRAPDWDPTGKGLRSQKILKLHGSLNWAYCHRCDSVTFLTEKERVADFLLTNHGVVCKTCESSDNLHIVIVPPVLAKLDEGDPVMRAVWRDAYHELRQAERVYIIGYSFPPSDVQTRLFLCKALREAPGLQEICVVSRPKFGTDRAQFEDRYTQALSGSQQEDNIRFYYQRFSRLDLGRLRSGPFA